MLMEERGRKVLENRALRKIFGPKDKNLTETGEGIAPPRYNVGR